MHYHPLMMLYVGPDQLMPITSMLAGVVALIVIFWTRVRMWLRKMGALIGLSDRHE